MSSHSSSGRSRQRRQEALETNVCRKGLTSTSSNRPAQLELPLDGEDLLGLLRCSGRITVFDLDVLAWLTERWREDRPADDWIRFTLYELGKQLYHREPDGKERRVMQASLRRLATITFDVVGYDARRRELRRGVAGLGRLLRNVQCELDRLPPDPAPGVIGALRGSTFEARFDDWMIESLAAGNITYLRSDVMRQLRGLAKRLWIYLEAERLKPIGPGAGACWIKLGLRAYTTLGMNYAHERQARAALKRAAGAIEQADPRWERVYLEQRPGGSGWAIIAIKVPSEERRAARAARRQLEARPLVA